MLTGSRDRNVLRRLLCALPTLAIGLPADCSQSGLTMRWLARLFATIYPDQSLQHKEQLVKHFLAIVNKAKEK